jgi:hypothetical protein
MAAHMRHYNFERLHTENSDYSPINYESSLEKVSDKGSSGQQCVCQKGLSFLKSQHLLGMPNISS